LGEVNFAAVKLKNNRASGPGGQNTKLNLIHILWKLTETRKEEIFLSPWEEELTCPTYKKGDRVMRENYCGVSVLNLAYKVLSVMLFQRLQPTVKTSTGNYQCGFRPAKSISDHLYSVREVLEIMG
jgi:hypothetical protein